jgi:uncharacterized membrane protein
MNWRLTIWIVTIVANIAFAILVFSTRSKWGPNDYIGGSLIILGTLMGVVALLAIGRPRQ